MFPCLIKIVQSFHFQNTHENTLTLTLFQINLLDMKRSMNVNIFLKQFRLPNEDIVAMVKEGKAEEINAERLKGLLKIIPERDEVRFKFS